LSERTQVVPVALDVFGRVQPGRVDLKRGAWRFFEQGLDEGLQQTLQVRGAVNFEAKRHDFDAERVSPEERLHAVGNFHLSIKHVPQQRAQ